MARKSQYSKEKLNKLKKLISSGESTSEISRQIGISPHTVNYYRYQAPLKTRAPKMAKKLAIKMKSKLDNVESSIKLKALVASILSEYIAEKLFNDE